MSLSLVVGSRCGERVLYGATPLKTRLLSASEKKIWVVYPEMVAPLPESFRTRTWMWIARPEYQPGQIVRKLT